MLTLLLAFVSADVTTASFSGQGLPRATKAACEAAGKKISELLQKKGFSQITMGCESTSEEIGEFVPAIHARHAAKHSLEQGIGQRRDNKAACEEDLKKLLTTAAASNILEQECLKGTEYDYKGSAKEFHQAWITKLVSHDPALKAVDAETRDNKSVAAPQDEKPEAPKKGKVRKAVTH